MGDDRVQSDSTLRGRKPIHWGWWVATAVSAIGYVWAMIAFLLRGGGLWQAVATTVVVLGTCVAAWVLWRRGGSARAEDSIADGESRSAAVRRWVIPLLVAGVLLMGLSLWLVYR
jgi:hypothetical protein